VRAALLTVIVFILLIFIIRQPYIGVLTWSWLAYMNPHRLAWATTIPYSMLVAIATLLALMISKEPKRIPWTRETILLLVLIAWMFMTTVFSLYPWLAWEQWDKVWRIMLMTYVTMMLINNEQRIKLLMFVIALSLGFYGFKGGWFTICHGGAHSVMGPDKPSSGPEFDRLGSDHDRAPALFHEAPGDPVVFPLGPAGGDRADTDGHRRNPIARGRLWALL
jgi:probable O-glycosylation ligase (exosortase A-associated)